MYDFVGKVGEGDLPEWQRSSQSGLMAPNPVLICGIFGFLCRFI